MNEPNKIQSGDSYEWTESYSDYPANEWILTYYFRGASTLNKAATTSGSNYTMVLTTSDTSGLVAGQYSFVAKVTKNSEVHTVASGKIEVLPDLANIEQNYDGTSHAQRTITHLENSIEEITENINATVSVNGVTYTRHNLSELRKLLFDYKNQIRKEKEEQRIANGLTSSNNILGRFQ